MTDKDKECRSQREAFEEWVNKSGGDYKFDPMIPLPTDTFVLMRRNAALRGFQAGAAWQQSRLLDDELVERATNAAAEYLRDRSGLYTDRNQEAHGWHMNKKQLIAALEAQLVPDEGITYPYNLGLNCAISLVNQLSEPAPSPEQKGGE